MTARVVPAVLLVLLAACSQPQATVGVTPTPSPTQQSPSPDPTATPSPVVPSPSPVADLPVTRVGFSCRLPVVTDVAGGDVRTVQGGLLALPAAKLSADDQGKFTFRYVEQDLATNAQPVLYGTGGEPFYDRARSRWVPVGAGQALADGSGYAYTTVDVTTSVSTVHVVDVASGAERTFRVAMSNPLQVADYRATGVYLVAPSALGGPGEGVWLLDPGTGKVTRARNLQRVWAVRGGFAWVARFDPRDKTTWAPSELPPANSIVRVDLQTGAEQAWFFRAGTYPWWVGFGPSGWPVVTTSHEGGRYEIFLLDHASPTGRIVYAGGLDFATVQGDGSRLWLGGRRGIYLYRPETGIQKVFAFDAQTSDGGTINPAGFCL